MATPGLGHQLRHTLALKGSQIPLAKYKKRMQMTEKVSVLPTVQDGFAVLTLFSFSFTGRGGM